MARLRIVFMGTPKLAANCLKALLNEPALEVAGAVTQPDRPKGRDLKLQSSPVKTLALEAGLPVLQPARAREPEFLARLQELRPDLIAVAAFGQILPQTILDLPTYGCINVHTSMLPKYRGAAPIQWAIANGDHETGVTIMKMDAGMDTGDILSQQSTPIRPEDDAISLHDRLATLGAKLLVKTIPEYVRGRVTARRQDPSLATLAPKITRQDGLIDWQLDAQQILNRLRAFTPWPGIFTFLSEPGGRVLLKILKAEAVECPGPPGEIIRADASGIVIACGQDALRVHALQREGGRRMTSKEFLAGHALGEGVKLG